MRLSCAVAAGIVLIAACRVVHSQDNHSGTYSIHEMAFVVWHTSELDSRPMRGPAAPGPGSPFGEIYLQSHGESTQFIAEGNNPAFSPDGTKIAYCAPDVGTRLLQVRVISVDRLKMQEVTKSEGGACLPDWSPDGKRLAITAYSGHGSSIVILDMTTGTSRSHTDGYGAKWSPKGDTLLLCRQPAAHEKMSSIWLVNADGSGLHKAIEDPSKMLEANWLPNGKAIAFTSTREHKSNSEIFQFNTDGTGLENIARNAALSFYHPIFSPDASEIVVDTISNTFGHGAYPSTLLLDRTNHKAYRIARGSHPTIIWHRN